MGGNLHRGFESLPLRSADGDRGAGVAAAAPALLQVAEEATQGPALDPVVRVEGERAHLPGVALEAVQLAVSAPVADIQPARGADGAPRGHARLGSACAPLARVGPAV